MNLTQVLNDALPDAGSPRRQESYPKIHPQLIFRQHQEREGPMIFAVVPDGPSIYFRFNQMQFELASLFDGQRSYAEVARLARENSGLNFTEAVVRDFADKLGKQDFWYRTPQERCAVLADQLRRDRRAKLKKTRARAADLSNFELCHFDPDRYLTWIYSKVEFVYTPWFTALSLALVLVMVVLLGARWDEVWNDSVAFYNFRQKNLWDVVEFYLIFIVLGSLHETAHGMSCKHYGGESHRMGVFFIYSIPGVFCDVTQAYVYGNRMQRIVTVASGVWSEIVLSSVVTIAWWFTAPGTFLHDLLYKFILSGGIFVLIINWNPFAKMDGYFLLCEILGFFDLRGQSIGFLSAWVRKNVFRMPATVPALPRLRQIGFAFYAVVAGSWSYLLLTMLVRLTYRIAFAYSPEWAFVPAAFVGYVMFKGRIQKFLKFCRELYMDKRELMRNHPWRVAAVAAALLIVGLLPIRREKVEERFMLEPESRAVLRAQVAGVVAQVLVSEGQTVRPGDTIARLRNLQLESRAAEAEMQYRSAAARATRAQLRYSNFGALDQERTHRERDARTMRERLQELNIVSPVAGIVVTPRVQDLAGSFVGSGALVAEVASTSSMLAHIYVPETEFQKLQKFERAAVHMDSQWGSHEARVISISPKARPLEPGLMAPPKYSGQHPPAYYDVQAEVDNPNGTLRDGMTGTAKLFGQRRSILGSLMQPVADSFARRVW